MFLTTKPNATRFHSSTYSFESSDARQQITGNEFYKRTKLQISSFIHLMQEQFILYGINH